MTSSLSSNRAWRIALGAWLGLAACGQAGDDPGQEESSVEASSGSGSVGSAGDEATDSDLDDASDDASSDADSSGRTSFVYTDAGDSTCGEQCDIWNLQDCPEGEKCTAVACEVGSNSWDTNVCREIQGDAQFGEPCTYTDGSGVSGNDTCASGNMCWDADPDTGVGTCIAFCTGSPDAPSCPTGGSCNVSGNGVLPVCFPHCDPLLQDCNSSTQICLPSPGDDGYVCVNDASGGMAPYATPCNFANTCNEGLLCVDVAAVPEAGCDGSGGCCSPMCDLSDVNNCPGTGQECIPVFDPQPEGYEDVGVCMVVDP